MNETPRARARWQTALVLTATALALAGCTGGNGDVARQNHLGFDAGVAPAAATDGLATAEAVALFVVGPALILLTVAALVWLPGVVRGNRYRPAKGWSASPLWFGGPPHPAAAVESAQPDQLTRGGASGNW